jgi:protein O-GlcNAc transferase
MGPMTRVSAMPRSVRVKPRRPSRHGAARHLGAMAFLHDTRKALDAYRRATALDPDNADGWNQLGHLLVRTGELSEAEAAYRKVEFFGETAKDQGLLAAAYGNLGNVYRARGQLDQAEAMYQKSLKIDQALRRKLGIACAYGNLGNVYQSRGKLNQAETMYRKSLEIAEALGHKEVMASQYGNLGNIYKMGGELDQA